VDELAGYGLRPNSVLLQRVPKPEANEAERLWIARLGDQLLNVFAPTPMAAGGDRTRSVRLPVSLLKGLDAHAKELGTNTNALFRQMIRDEMADESAARDAAQKLQRTQD
jgi:hypothetical protein